MTLHPKVLQWFARVARLARAWLRRIVPKMPDVPEPWGRWAQVAGSVVAVVGAIVVPACAMWGGLIPLGGDGATPSPRPTPIPGDSVAFVFTGAFVSPSYADLTSAGLEPHTDGTYDLAEYSERTRDGSGAARTLAVGNPSQFRVSFTLANGKDGYRTVVRSIDLIVDSFTAIASETPVGCRYGGAGGDGPEKIVRFDAMVNSTEVGLEYQLVLDLPPDTLVTLTADDLEIFQGTVDITHAGRYLVRLVAHFENSAGQSGTVTSMPMELVVVPQDQAQYFRPAGFSPDRFPCPYAAGE